MSDKEMEFKLKGSKWEHKSGGKVMVSWGVDDYSYFNLATTYIENRDELTAIEKDVILNILVAKLPQETMSQWFSKEQKKIKRRKGKS